MHIPMSMPMSVPMQLSKEARRLWIDGDGCPVVDLAIAIAKRNGLPVTVVKNYAVTIESTYAEIVTVDVAMDSADYYIANHLQKGDIVITQDYGLAAMVLAKNGCCINQNGKEITPMTIDFLLESRHHSRKDRMSGKRGPKHKKRTAEDNEAFVEAFSRLVSQT